MEHHGTAEHYGTPWNTTEHHGTLRNITEHRNTKFDGEKNKM